MVLLRSRIVIALILPSELSCLKEVRTRQIRMRRKKMLSGAICSFFLSNLTCFLSSFFIPSLIHFIRNYERKSKIMTGKANSFKPEEAIKFALPGFRIEAEGSLKSSCAIISGVISVESFSSNAIELTTRRECIGINGKMLKISIFESKTIEISGKIESFCFFEKKRSRRRKSEN